MKIGNYNFNIEELNCFEVGLLNYETTLKIHNEVGEKGVNGGEETSIQIPYFYSDIETETLKQDWLTVKYFCTIHEGVTTIHFTQIYQG